MAQLSRRDFLKVAGATLAGSFASQKLNPLRLKDITRPNIIIILMDALSANHLSLYGYPRSTSPNIDAFAERSTVFHKHYSAGNFTTAGTASMLTGMLPWKHGAFMGGGLVRPEFVDTNPYTLLGSDYYRFGFLQNTWADYLVSQYNHEVDRFLSPFSYDLVNENKLLNLLKNDRTMASIATNDFLFSMEGTTSPPGASVIGYLNKSYVLNLANAQKSARYPKGTPEAMSGIPFYNEEVYRGVYKEISRLEDQGSPYFSYFHLYSPHYPYRPRADYRKLFQDKYAPAKKPAHPILTGLPENYLLTQRSLYDRQIAQVDHEFGKLISQLGKDGVLNNSYLILTSDHGELFERGFLGHGDLFLYEGALHIPLVIHSPKQTKREDIFALTSNTDILPTLLSIAGKNPAPNVDGRILPAFGGAEEDADRPIFSVYAYDSSTFAPIKKAVLSMRKHTHKIIAYLGYTPEKIFELYDIENDPDELVNLAFKDVKLLNTMKDELFTHLDEANRLFANR